MIKTKVAFLHGRLFSNQSEQFKRYSKSSSWLEKAGPPKKPLLCSIFEIISFCSFREILYFEKFILKVKVLSFLSSLVKYD